MKFFHYSFFSLLYVLFFLLPSQASAHGDISKYPPAVQILQYKMALFMNPDDLETKNRLAIAYWLDGQMDEAQKQFGQVLGKDPRNFNALDGMGLVYLKKGEPEIAMEYFEKAEQINPSDVLVHVHKALTYEKLKKTEEANKEFERARSLARGPIQQKKIEDEIKLLSKTR